MKLRIEKAVYGGSGLARITDPQQKLAGKAVFVPFTLPGELVEATITADKRSYATADLQDVLEPAAARVMPGCEYFGRCGGCHYQQASYPEQLAIKQAILAETLQRAKIIDAPPIQVLSAEPWEYRNRIRLVVNSDSGFSLGYRQQRSHTTVAVARCPIAAPLLQRAITALTESGSGLAGWCSEIELFINDTQTSLMTTLLTAHAGPGADARLRQVCERVHAAMPELQGAALVVGSTDEQDRSLHANWGETALRYRVRGFVYRVSAEAFFQVNRFLVDDLVQLVTEAKTGTLAWDLYAGVGLFARALTGSFEEVVAVESAASYEDLKQNLAGTSARAVRAGTKDFLSSQLRAKTSAPPSIVPDLIVIDPPRAGVGPEICELLSKVAARELVYISCDPATMSRDLGSLLQSRYCLQSLTLVDLFPQTFHMETVAVLARR